MVRLWVQGLAKYAFMASLGGSGTLMDYANSLWLNGFSIRLRKLRLEKESA
ncbi:MAG: hypothetical protein QXG01_03280 [Candidatus Bathyarchaeia archaeon]